MSFFEELKRRNVFKVALAYLVASWLVLQITDVLMGVLSLPDTAGKFVFMLMVIGFIPAMVFAWAYEVTPEGIKRESEVDRSEWMTHETAARLNRTTIVLLVAVAVMVVVDRFVPESAVPEGETGLETVSQQADQEKGSEPFSQQAADPGPGQVDGKRALTPDEPSVAVLPFVNMSSDPEQEYFSDGISEEILNVLTRIPNLKVAARTSSFQFKGQNRDIADIAQQLKVNHILEGSVRKAGNQLRITAQLIEAESGFHMWSNTFDRQLEDVFAIQDEIASAIAGELRTRLTPGVIEASTVVDVDAYELYLKGIGLVATRKEEDLFAAFDVLKDVLEIEPTYVPAMATLAKGYVVAPYYSTRITAREFREQGRQWATRALELEPDNTEALSVMSVILNEQDMNSEEALKLLRRAIQGNPGNLAANNFLGDVLFRIGAFEEAAIYESRAMEMDPLAPVHISDLGHLLVTIGDYDRALELADRGLGLNPSFWNSHQNRFESHWALGNLELFEAAVRNTMESMNLSDTTRLSLIATVDMARGDVEAAQEKVESLTVAVNEGRYDAVDLAFTAVRIGDFDTAGEMLLRALEEGDGTWMFPIYVRLPEQAPESRPWQAFWSLPGPARIAKIRRANGMIPHYPGFGDAAK